jgi:hypothetical protein
MIIIDLGNELRVKSCLHPQEYTCELWDGHVSVSYFEFCVNRNNIEDIENKNYFVKKNKIILFGDHH